MRFFLSFLDLILILASSTLHMEKSMVSESHNQLESLRIRIL